MTAFPGLGPLRARPASLELPGLAAARLAPTEDAADELRSALDAPLSN